MTMNQNVTLIPTKKGTFASDWEWCSKEKFSRKTPGARIRVTAPPGLQWSRALKWDGIVLVSNNSLLYFESYDPFYGHKYQNFIQCNVVS